MYRDSQLGVVFHHGILSRTSFTLRLASLVNVISTLVYAAIFARIVLEYVQAPQSRLAFWIDKVTDPVYLPLRDIVRDGQDVAGHPIAWSLLLLMLALAIVQGCIVALLRQVARPRLEMDE